MQIAMSNSAPVHSANPKTILLVDDNSAERKTRAIMLSTHGYEVIATNNMENAYALCTTRRPDLVLLAVAVGAGLALWQRMMAANPKQLIAFLSGNSLHLSPILSMSDMLCIHESPDNFIGRVEALLRA